MLKKPSIVLSSYGGVQNLYWPQQNSSNQNPPSLRIQQPRRSAQHDRALRPQFRFYANVRNDKSSRSQPEDLSWPETASISAIPTPYEIFKQKKGAPYSKTRFYELVKIYHPDRSGSETDSPHSSCLSHAVRLERYRLVITANDILSDPVKRSAYDRYGSGWDGCPEIGLKHKYKWGDKKRGFSGFYDNDSPARNATWEDWERWYQRDQQKPKQEPLYFSNGGFFSLVVFVAILGGLGQVTRVGDISKSFMEQVEAMHDETSKDLRRRRKESLSFGNKDERVQNFLKSRDPVGYGVTDPKEEGFRKLLPEPEVCMSGDVKGRNA